MTTTWTDDLDVARQWCDEVEGEHGALAHFLDPTRFVDARRHGATVWLSLEHTTPFGVVIGPDTRPLPQWVECLVDGPASAMPGYERVGGWDLLTRPTDSEGSCARSTDDEDAVEALLRAAAPASSVWPGDPSVVAWYGDYVDADLVATAALVRWGSGRHPIASVATATGARREGRARRLVSGVIVDAARRGIDHVALGVGLENAGARALYLGLGFTHRARLVRWRRLALGS